MFKTLKKALGVSEEQENAEHSANNKHTFEQLFHFGIPATATVLGFDSVQRLMAVGTSTGLLKVYLALQEFYAYIEDLVNVEQRC
jgi:hypothetical protein